MTYLTQIVNNLLAIKDKILQTSRSRGHVPLLSPTPRTSVAARESSGLRKCRMCRPSFAVIPVINQLCGSFLVSSSSALLNSRPPKAWVIGSCLCRWPPSSCHSSLWCNFFKTALFSTCRLCSRPQSKLKFLTK